MNHGLYGEPWPPSHINGGTPYALGIVLQMGCRTRLSGIVQQDIAELKYVWIWKVTFRGSADRVLILGNTRAEFYPAACFNTR